MGTDVQKWGDAHMYRSEPLGTTTPKVTLISMTPDPLGVLAMAAKTYRGEYAEDLSQITDEERLSYFQDMSKTTLNAAFECIDFHFRITGVTRAFTHQLVRQRTAVYFQESMRFAVIDENMRERTGLPPSLVGTKSWIEHRRECDEAGVDHETNTSEAQAKRFQWDDALDSVGYAYKNLVNAGMPAEEARGLLPTNILTRIQYKTNLRNLVQHAGLRLCTQAQFEWRHVFAGIAKAIREAKVYMPIGNYSEYGVPGHSFPVHMANQISDNLFRPVCYQTGKCQFEASFDRSCTIRERVNANATIGRKPADWDRSTLVGEPTDYGNSVERVGNGVGYGKDDRIVKINAIQTAEWLVDDTAARS